MSAPEESKSILIRAPNSEPVETTLEQILAWHAAGSIPEGTCYLRAGQWKDIGQVIHPRMKAPGITGAAAAPAQEDGKFAEPGLYWVWQIVAIVDAFVGLVVGIGMMVTSDGHPLTGLIVLVSCLASALAAATTAAVINYLAEIAHHARNAK